MLREELKRLATVLGTCACAALAAVTTARPAFAEEPPSADRLKAAADEYDRGRRAFLADDFEGAAVHFESAFRDAPRAETLRLAIRARRKSKQLGRAATLAAIANELYPGDPPTAQLAKETLDEAKPLLHEYAVECNTECAVAADGRVVSQSDAQKHRIFLEPGPHELGVSFKTGGVARHIDAKKAGKETLSFEAPPAPSPVTPVAPPIPGPIDVRPPPADKPLGPVVFFVGVGLTAALGAATIVSGIDAKNNPGVDAVRQACAGKDESCPEYKSGKSAELRTNVLLAGTIGVAAVTGVVGVFFTQWSSSATRSGTGTWRFGAAPLARGGAVGASGTF